ncbi:hypothetical protein BD408DRAFT_223391 [Parasitella parasitica]|nr:hypothetical protein BD408DRAFT_223391 [Parasitella parasitica]
MTKRRKRLELSYRKGSDRLAAYERKSSGAKKPIMFVGDRGYGFSSRIKGHKRFCGFWKQPKSFSIFKTLCPSSMVFFFRVNEFVKVAKPVFLLVCLEPKVRARGRVKCSKTSASTNSVQSSLFFFGLTAFLFCVYTVFNIAVSFPGLLIFSSASCSTPLGILVLFNKEMYSSS